MKSSQLIKVGICVAYDWDLLKNSLPRIYENADIICLGLDKDRHAWSCIPYEFDNEAFFSFVQEIDRDKKIIVYEDDFSLERLDKRQNCNRHRMLIAEKMGIGGWHIQIDADEYFLDFHGFTQYLKLLNNNPQPYQKAINICCPFVPLIKKVTGGYLYVNFRDSLPEIIPMATNKPDYQRARQNGHFNHISTFYVIHETWAREDDELWFKINNWGHASEELGAQAKRISYYNLWKSLDNNNYQFIFNFHPALPKAWPVLSFGEGENAGDFIRKFQLPKFPLSQFSLALKNSRNIARLKSLLRRVI